MEPNFKQNFPKILFGDRNVVVLTQGLQNAECTLRKIKHFTRKCCHQKAKWTLQLTIRLNLNKGRKESIRIIMKTVFQQLHVLK